MIVLKVDVKTTVDDGKTFFTTLRVDNDSQIVYEGIYGEALNRATQIKKAIGFANLVVTKEAIIEGHPQLEGFKIL